MKIYFLSGSSTNEVLIIETQAIKSIAPQERGARGICAINVDGVIIDVKGSVKTIQARVDMLEELSLLMEQKAFKENPQAYSQFQNMYDLLVNPRKINVEKINDYNAIYFAPIEVECFEHLNQNYPYKEHTKEKELKEKIALARENMHLNEKIEIQNNDKHHSNQKI